ncbi:MAG: glycosyltransferase [Verrucomicrobiae bacterium]|nr:glycosyltransferase [Verrucomicrobiae bacterium]
MSCLSQTDLGKGHRLIICDDSESEEEKSRVDSFCKEHPTVELIRRGDRAGYKAGNINHALGVIEPASDDWIVIVDADELLDPAHLWSLGCFIHDLPESVGIVQGLSDRRLPAQTRLQECLSLEIPLCFRTVLPSRGRFGFVPYLGHAGAFRAGAWKAAGGFPAVVSEDYAFAIRLRSLGFQGVVWQGSTVRESYPNSFKALFRRLSKFSSGTGELFRYLKKEATFSRSGVITASEKFDALMQLGIYVINPIALLNVFVFGWLSGRSEWMNPILVPPLLPYLFLTLTLWAVSFLPTGSPRFGEIFRYWSTASTVYLSLSPAVAFAFVRGLIKGARFDPTHGRTSNAASLPAREFRLAMIFTPILGIGALLLGSTCDSPFRWVIAGHGISYLLFPIGPLFNREDFLGSICRGLFVIPTVCFILALVALYSQTWY